MTKKETVINYFKNQISAGKLCPGDRILSENQIIDYLHVSRNTARNALKEMVFEGILEARKGSGTYVKDNNKKKKKIVISTKQAFFIYEPGFYIRRLICRFEEMIKSMGYEPYINFEKGEEAFEYYESKSDINSAIFSFENEIAAFLSINGNTDICAYFAQKGIPVLAVNNSRNNFYFSVMFDYVDLFNKTINFANNMGKNVIFFLHINPIPDTETSKFTIFHVFEHIIDSEFIKVNVPVYEKNQGITDFMDNYLSKMKDIPDGIVFFQDTIYINTLPLFPKYDKIFKNTEMLVISNNDEFYPENYNIKRIVFDPEEVCEITFSMLKKLLEEKIPLIACEMIKGKII